MAKKIFIIICIFIGSVYQINAQNKTDCDFIFKTWLFIEHLNQGNYGKDLYSKDSSLFNNFQNQIILKMDTLKNWEFSNNYLFFKIDGKNINYNKRADLQLVSIQTENCDGYVLGVNIVNGRSFRLMGFNGNDFLTLFEDVADQFYKTESKRLSMRYFLRHFKVTGLDFKCIYDSLKSIPQKQVSCSAKCSSYKVTIN